MSQPIYRDAVINGQFLAGATTIAVLVLSVVMVISGLSLTLMGVVPGVEEVLRLAIYVGITIFYILSGWPSHSLFHCLRSVATSFLASVALSIFFSFRFARGDSRGRLRRSCGEERRSGPGNRGGQRADQRGGVPVIQMFFYSNATATIVDPMRKTTRSFVLMGPMEQILRPASRFLCLWTSLVAASSSGSAHRAQLDLLCRVLLQFRDAGDKDPGRRSIGVME